ncbi:uncharacterized protein BJ171DRAFT_509203 [Polychytrium aggregatum]|uniref:uncharacterized protein n=1 Tax=Polychytrium aggregatum TaxID=110093 RepID=UPI0022FE2725|nr:uncharacterized protein BJ171DRAFT_509203 [Polychytrium aggregatum]KAI9203658.1 hypothetical protein BJ171DRAFT_509203 [Polychytrium aggregatum]
MRPLKSLLLGVLLAGSHLAHAAKTSFNILIETPSEWTQSANTVTIQYFVDPIAANNVFSSSSYYVVYLKNNITGNPWTNIALPGNAGGGFLPDPSPSVDNVVSIDTQVDPSLETGFWQIAVCASPCSSSTSRFSSSFLVSVNPSATRVSVRNIVRSSTPSSASATDPASVAPSPASPSPSPSSSSSTPNVIRPSVVVVAPQAPVTNVPTAPFAPPAETGSSSISNTGSPGGSTVNSSFIMVGAAGVILVLVVGAVVLRRHYSSHAAESKTPEPPNAPPSQVPLARTISPTHSDRSSWTGPSPSFTSLSQPRFTAEDVAGKSPTLSMLEQLVIEATAFTLTRSVDKSLERPPRLQLMISADLPAELPAFTLSPLPRIPESPPASFSVPEGEASSASEQQQ